MRRSIKIGIAVGVSFATATTSGMLYAQDAANPPMEAPPGTYKLDKAHASLIFRVNHLGFSNYTARFKTFDAALRFDPGNPTAMSVTASVDPTSIETDFPQSEKLDFNAELRGTNWLNTVKFSTITYTSTSVTLTGANRAAVVGELELHGVKRPVTLEVTFNGGYPGMSLDPNARVGFSARGTLRRSEFGIKAGIPAAGSTMGVSDEVEVQIEAEFNGPPLANQKAAN